MKGSSIAVWTGIVLFNVVGWYMFGHGAPWLFKYVCVPIDFVIALYLAISGISLLSEAKDRLMKAHSLTGLAIGSIFGILLFVGGITWLFRVLESIEFWRTFTIMAMCCPTILSLSVMAIIVITYLFDRGESHEQLT